MSQDFDDDCGYGPEWNPNRNNPNGTIVPSPIPPWHRPVVSPLTNTLTADGTISLVNDTTYLNSTQIRMVNGVPNPYQVVLPNGNYLRQTITILNNTANVRNQNSATFVVTGNIAGVNTLTFNNIGFSAVLQWDGTNWILIGGNAVVA